MNSLDKFVRENFRYEPETGHVYWAKSGSGRKMGTPAGRYSDAGYLMVTVLGRAYRLHRIAWFLATGAWPQSKIDHKNGARDDNRLSNLRPASDAQNQQNRKIQSNNKTGFPGVSYISRLRKWKAEIAANRRNYYLGCFSSPEEAFANYCEAKSRLHQFNPNVRT